MSLISAFRLFLHLSCETPVYDRSGARSATIGRSFLKYIPQCPMSYAPCSMPHVPCTMHHAPCPMSNVLCPMSYAPCTMSNVLCTMHHVLFMTRFSLCHSFLRSVLSPVLHTVHRPLADPEREARLYTYPFEIRFSHVENVLWTTPPSKTYINASCNNTLWPLYLCHSPGSSSSHRHSF